MLPTISLPLTDSTALSGETGEFQSPAGGSASPEGSFADLLRAPVMVSSYLADGEGLPPGGNVLPGSDESPRSEPDQLAALLRKQADAPFSDLQNARSAIQLEDQKPLAEERALQLSEEQALALVSPIPAPGAATRSSSPGSAEAAVAAMDDLPAEWVGATKSAADGERGRRPVSNAADSMPGVLTTRQTETSLPTARPAGAELPVNTENMTVLSSNNAPTPTSATPLPLAAQPASGALPLTTAASAAPMIDTITVPVQNSTWGEALNERVVFMTGQKLQNAEIRLTPAELGPIRVSIAMEDGATNITFNAQHATTREAIESALPRLREMLSEQGLSLGNASVNDQQAGDGGSRDAAGERVEQAQATVAGQTTADGTTDGDAGDIRLLRGLVDTFA